MAWEKLWPGIVYGMARQWYMVKPGGYGMAWRAWHGIWYGLAGILWNRICSGEPYHGILHGLAMHGLVYDMAWWAQHDMWFGLAAMIWYMIWPGGHHVVYGMAWRGMSWYVESYRITCIKALSWAIVPFTRGVADVKWRSC